MTLSLRTPFAALALVGALAAPLALATPAIAAPSTIPSKSLAPHYDARYGASCVVPSGWVPTGDSTTDTFEMLHPEGGAAVVCDAEAVKGSGDAELKALVSKANDDGWTTTKSTVKDGVLTWTGVKDDQARAIRAVTDGQTIMSSTWTYPAEARGYYEPAVTNDWPTNELNLKTPEVNAPASTNAFRNDYNGQHDFWCQVPSDWLKTGDWKGHSTGAQRVDEQATAHCSRFGTVDSTVNELKDQGWTITSDERTKNQYEIRARKGDRLTYVRGLTQQGTPAPWGDLTTQWTFPAAEKDDFEKLFDSTTLVAFGDKKSPVYKPGKNADEPKPSQTTQPSKDATTPAPSKDATTPAPSKPSAPAQPTTETTKDGGDRGIPAETGTDDDLVTPLAGLGLGLTALGATGVVIGRRRRG